MRIIAGSAGGRRLVAPPEGTRPTTDRVREALFSSLDSVIRLEHGGWQGVRVLDLFAGSGAVGLEAMSRGAGSATLVERDRRCAEVLRRNVAAVAPSAHVVVADAMTWTPTGGPFDLVYVDPPYSVPDEDVRAFLSAFWRHGAFADGAVVVVERAQRSGDPWPDRGFERIRNRDYGDTRLWYGRASQPGAASPPRRATAMVEEEA